MASRIKTLQRKLFKFSDVNLVSLISRYCVSENGFIIKTEDIASAKMICIKKTENIASA